MERIHPVRPLGCVVLAAGRSERFGAPKLAAELGGKTLLRRALEAVPPDAFSAVRVVVSRPDAAALAEEFGFCAVLNPHPERGQSSSVRLGLEELTGCAGVLFLVADQPLLRRDTVARLVRVFQSDPSALVCAAHGGVRGNPCLFPARFFPELLALEGDVGGGVVIRRHPDAVRLVEVPARELTDVDTPAQLSALEQAGQSD